MGIELFVPLRLEVCIPSSFRFGRELFISQSQPVGNPTLEFSMDSDAYSYDGPCCASN